MYWLILVKINLYELITYIVKICRMIKRIFSPQVRFPTRFSTRQKLVSLFQILARNTLVSVSIIGSLPVFIQLFYIYKKSEIHRGIKATTMTKRKRNEIRRVTLLPDLIGRRIHKTDIESWMGNFFFFFLWECGKMRKNQLLCFLLSLV